MQKLQEKSFQSNGFEFKYLDTKSGNQTLIFLPGLGECKELWLEVLEKFPEYRCIVLDLPGGANSALGKIQSIDDFAEFCKIFIKELNIDNFIFVGYSLGGLIALKYAEIFKDPKHLKGIVTWASPLGRFDENISRVFFITKTIFEIIPVWISSRLQKRSVIKFLADMLGLRIPDRYVDSFVRVHIPSILRLIDIMEVNEINFPSDIPVLAVLGDTDKIVPERNAENIQCLDWANLQCKVVKGGGHFGSEKGREAEVSIIRKFLDLV